MGAGGSRPWPLLGGWARGAWRPARGTLLAPRPSSPVRCFGFFFSLPLLFAAKLLERLASMALYPKSKKFSRFTVTSNFAAHA